MQRNQIQLRSLRLSDSQLLYEWINNRELVNFNAPYHPVSEAEHKAWFESVIINRTDLSIFMIEDLSNKCAIGSCQLLNINSVFRSGEIQIRIGEFNSWNKGIGTEAIRLLCEFGFRDLNLNRIYLHVFATNIRAIRVYEKNKFVREGILRQAAYINNEFVDVVYMGLLKSDYEQSGSNSSA
jgi:RimJ/RimL family protein N-acetyltransferase